MEDQESQVYLVNESGLYEPRPDQTESALIVITFSDSSQAETLLESLKKMDKAGQLTLEDAVILVKDESGETKVKQTSGKGAHSGARWGSFLGLVVGMAFGGPLLGLVGGGLLGKKLGKVGDLGIDDSFVKSVSGDLDAGHAALFVLGHSANVGRLLAEFKKVEGTVYHTNLSPDAAERVQKALDSQSE